MVIKKFDYTLFILLIIISVMYFITELFIDKLKTSEYTKISHEYTKQIKTLIKEKKNTTKVIALSLSNGQVLKEALLKNDHKLLDLQYYSEQLRDHSDFKNVWFQVVDKEGNSFKRSWTKKRGDNLLGVRTDIDMMLKSPKVISTISTGKFDMTFKTMVPIVDKGKFLGLFEVITHFNSISKKLLDQGIDSVFLVDKSYKKQIIKPLSKLFVKDYYVANSGAKEDYLDYLEFLPHLISF